MVNVVTLAMILLWVGDTQGRIVYSSQYNQPCLNECARYGQSYTWCKTRSGWDNCSPYRGLTYQGIACKTDCGTVGTDYYWCYDVHDSWGYCSVYGDERFVANGAIDYRGYYCLEPCHQTDGSGYYWCRTADSWGYCSPNPGLDTQGHRCKSDHFCGKHGNDYYWCNNELGSWDRCGIHDNCAYFSTNHAATGQSQCEGQLPNFFDPRDDLRHRRQVGRQICAVSNGGRHPIITTMVAEENNAIQQEMNRNVERDAFQLISRVDFASVDDRTGGGVTLITSTYTRLDYQGAFNRNGVRYANLQLQINRARCGDSTTVAALIMPVNTVFNIRYIRRALYESLDHHDQVTLSRTSQ